MDKTGWIVVTLCAGLLGLQMYYNSTDEQQPAAPATPAAATAPADNTATATAPAAAPAATTVATAPAAPAPAAEKKVIATLTSKDAEGKPVARYNFSNIGGSISNVEMLGQVINSTREELKNTDVCINSNPDAGIGNLVFGLSNDRAPQFDQAVYEYRADLSNDNQVTLLGRVGDLIVRKVYTLKPVKQGEETVDGNAYVLNLKVDVQNTSGQTLNAQDWGLYAGGIGQISKDESSYYTYHVRLEDGSFEKNSASDFRPWLGKEKERIYDKGLDTLEWAGVMNQYYASIVKPDKTSGNNSLYSAPAMFPLQVSGDKTECVEVALGMPDFSLSGKTDSMMGGQKSFAFDIYTGPKLNLMLDGLTDDFRMIDRVMDYGIFTIIAYPMNWLVNLYHGWMGNWGWAIIAMTITIRLLIWPLYRKSYVSMKRMSQLQPQMQALKEKYPNDPQKVNTEMMRLYQEYGISPMGGCLPMLLQMPIFFSFFYVLQTAAEFRGEGFIGWVTDLSQMDTVFSFPFMGYEVPVNILPILMATSTLIQMHMTPATGDATQVKIMRWMPLMFFLFCYTYPSALGLYWTTSNLISIIQTLIIRRLPVPELVKVQKKKGGKKSFMERMLEQQAALERQRQAQGK